jgi:hypothetical protein
MKAPSFQLPDFLRSAWVSDSAREIWKPRFERIRDSWPSVAIQSVAAGHTECVLRTLPSRMFFRIKAEARRHDVECVALGVRGLAVPCYWSDSPPPIFGRPFLYNVAFGTPESCREMESLWERREYAAAYRTAGFPGCCVAALARDIETRRIDAAGRYAAADGCTEVEHAAMPDAFWSWLNIEPSDLAPCSLHCAKAIAQKLAWISSMAELGFYEEADWLRDVLSWPIEWSALHGIAELKTPVIKASWTTDAANRKATLRYRGDGYPREGATGLRFPYRAPANTALTSSRAFQRGLENLIQIG